MAETPPATYLSIALGALVAELDELSPGLSERAANRLKDEADRSIVWGLHGEHESEADRRAHDQAVQWLGRLHSVVARVNRRVKLKGTKRRKA